jgi:hypothetical protein
MPTNQDIEALTLNESRKDIAYFEDVSEIVLKRYV